MRNCAALQLSYSQLPHPLQPPPQRLIPSAAAIVDTGDEPAAQLAIIRPLDDEVAHVAFDIERHHRTGAEAAPPGAFLDADELDLAARQRAPAEDIVEDRPVRFVAGQRGSS